MNTVPKMLTARDLLARLRMTKAPEIENALWLTGEPYGPGHLYRYAVVGAGLFPFDQLRNEMAYPSSEEDADKMAKIMTATTRVVRLTGHKRPSVGAWRYEGWGVCPLE